MDRRAVTGLVLALASGAAFGTSGAFAKGLLEAGWSPGAAVTWRVTVAALVMALPAALLMRGKWHRMRRGWPSVVLFGLVAVAGCQLAYFLAVERLSVAVALLLEYLGIVLVVGWLWFRHGERPRPLTVLGAGISIVGLTLMLDVFGAVQVDPIGVMWGLIAATGLATYFLVSADESHGLPALVVAAGGLGVGALALVVAGVVGVVPMVWNTSDVELAGLQVPWWTDVAALGVVAAAFAYASGVMAVRRLGSKLASFVGLTEVMFAVLWAWLLLSELPAPIQLLGGALILAGVVAVKLDERPRAVTHADPLPEGHGTPRPGPDGIPEQLPHPDEGDLQVEPIPQ